MAQTQSKKTFRFEFSQDVIELIERFAIVHQYDERKSYKEHWNNWYTENKEAMEKEIERINAIGYVGDVKDKMFKAGRYYFRKKNIKKEEPEQIKMETTESNNEKKRRNYSVKRLKQIKKTLKRQLKNCLF